MPSASATCEVPVPEDRQYGDAEQQEGEGEQGVDDAHQDRLDPPAGIARDEADGSADQSTAQHAGD